MEKNLFLNWRFKSAEAFNRIILSGICRYRLLREQCRQPKNFANINEMSTKGDIVNTMIHYMNRYLHDTLNVSGVTFEVRVTRLRQSSPRPK